jgi:two-component system sensor histidine kinase KdpD
MELRRSAGQSLGVLAGVAAVTILIAGLRGALVVPNLAPIYLLAVILCAVSWGWWSALASAVLAFLAYNFFFVEPVHTFTIHDPQVWVELLVFLLVAAVTSNLAARERARREEARQRAEEATLLYSVSRALGSRPLEEALGEVAELLRAALDLRGCAILLAGPDGQLEPKVEVGELDGRLTDGSAEWLLAPPRGGEAARRWIVVRRPGRPAQSAGHHVPLRVDQHMVGSLRLAAPPGGLRPQAARLLATVAEQLAAAVERERLRQAANEAELLRRTDELRGALLSSVSHDLRTPLAAIKASAGSLLQGDVDWSAADRDGFAETIDREADRLDRLVRNLLDMSRIEGGALRPRREWYDLAELVREVAARLGPMLADHPLTLDLPDPSAGHSTGSSRDLEPALSGAKGQALPPVRIDYLMIDQVLTNLLENAVKHTPPGTPIEVTLGRADGGLRVCVIDRGPGVPPEAAGRVFDKFQRGGAAGGPPGSGLGLAVSRGFVEAHGGRLELAPTPGGGATFCFTLPVEGPGPSSPVSGPERETRDRTPEIAR